MKLGSWGVLLLLWMARDSQASANVNGVLLLHADTRIEFTAGVSEYCGLSSAIDCPSVITDLPADSSRTYVIYVLAAIPDTSQARLRGLTFGVTYDSTSLVIVDHGSCGDEEYPTADWPSPNTGTSVVWLGTVIDHLAEVYWFAAHTYGSAPTSLALVPHPDPVLGGNFADDSVPAQLESIAGYGQLGFGQPGRLPACSSTRGAGENYLPSGFQGNGGTGPPPLANADEYITIAPGNRVVLEGEGTRHELAGGDLLHVFIRDGVCQINGVRYRPQPEPPPRLHPVADLRSLYRAVPEVIDYLESHSGDSLQLWNDAADSWGRQVDLLYWQLRYSYARELEGGTPPRVAAERVAIEAARSPLVETAAAVGDHYVTCWLWGRPQGEQLDLHDPGPRRDARDPMTEADAEALLRVLRRIAERPTYPLLLRNGYDMPLPSSLSRSPTRIDANRDTSR